MKGSHKTHYYLGNMVVHMYEVLARDCEDEFFDLLYFASVTWFGFFLRLVNILYIPCKILIINKISKIPL